MKIYSRADWGAALPVFDRLAHQPVNSIGEAFVHHSAGFGAPIDHLSEQIACLQQMQAFHQQTRGWADIAYHYIVFQPYGALNRARVFAGRPTNVVPAAQMNHNMRTLAVCIVQMDPEPLKQNTEWRVGRLIRRFDSVKHVRGHYEVFGTECPGTKIKPHLDNIAKIAGKSR